MTKMEKEIAHCVKRLEKAKGSEIPAARKAFRDVILRANADNPEATKRALRVVFGCIGTEKDI